ncbi:MAG: YggS family pyridoxal phosphate-dependent enzyme [Bdellovibrionales bacterium]
MTTGIASNLETVRQRIIAAAQASGREPGSVRLIAVSKGKPAADIQAALAAGQNIFGENRVQEAKSKFSELRAVSPGLELHLIGPLQTNKAVEAVRVFDVIQTLDRPRLADALAAAIKKTGRNPLCFIEINSGEEPQKAGIAPREFEGFLAYCRSLGLNIDGVMCIPPAKGDAAPHFMRMKEVAERHGLTHVSMGMSHDFETAIRHGATEVRVGTAIFGARP